MCERFILMQHICVNHHCKSPGRSQRRRYTIDCSPTISPLAAENRGPRPTALYPNLRNTGARLPYARQCCTDTLVLLSLTPHFYFFSCLYTLPCHCTTQALAQELDIAKSSDLHFLSTVTFGGAILIVPSVSGICSIQHQS